MSGFRSFLDTFRAQRLGRKLSREFKKTRRNDSARLVFIIRKLGRCHCSKAVSVLEDKWETPWGLEQEIIKALGATGQPQAMAFLSTLLRTYWAGYVIEALISFGPPAQFILLEFVLRKDDQGLFQRSESAMKAAKAILSYGFVSSDPSMQGLLLARAWRWDESAAFGDAVVPIMAQEFTVNPSPELARSLARVGTPHAASQMLSLLTKWKGDGTRFFDDVHQRALISAVLSILPLAKGPLLSLIKEGGDLPDGIYDLGATTGDGAFAQEIEAQLSRAVNLPPSWRLWSSLGRETGLLRHWWSSYLSAFPSASLETFPQAAPNSCVLKSC